MLPLAYLDGIAFAFLATPGELEMNGRAGMLGSFLVMICYPAMCPAIVNGFTKKTVDTGVDPRFAWGTGASPPGVSGRFAAAS
jgi:hypothetical protein